MHTDLLEYLERRGSGGYLNQQPDGAILPVETIHHSLES